MQREPCGTPRLIHRFIFRSADSFGVHNIHIVRSEKTKLTPKLRTQVSSFVPDKPFLFFQLFILINLLKQFNSGDPMIGLIADRIRRPRSVLPP